MNRPILHVATSASFMEFTTGVFEEAAPGDNVFVGVDTVLNHLHVPQGARLEHVTSGREGMERLAGLIAQSRIVIFHAVTPKVVRALASAPPSTLRVWSGWGWDYYGTTFNGSAGLLGPTTRRLVNRMLGPKAWVNRTIYTLIFAPILRAAARSTDVFSAPIPDDLGVFRKRFPGFRGRYSQLNYVSLESSIATGVDRAPGPDILVGNSASPANNHLEVFGLLARQNLSGRRVLVPLSYGDQTYAGSVTEAGVALLGERFVPVTEFMPLAEYNKLLAGCGIVIIGARRQMALGNILRAIWQGAHVVLDRRSPVVSYLQRHGVNVMLLDELATGSLPSEPLSESQVAANRAFLKEHWGHATVIRNTRALIDLV